MTTGFGRLGAHRRLPGRRAGGAATMLEPPAPRPATSATSAPSAGLLPYWALRSLADGDAVSLLAGRPRTPAAVLVGRGGGCCRRVRGLLTGLPGEPEEGVEPSTYALRASPQPLTEPLQVPESPGNTGIRAIPCQRVPPRTAQFQGHFQGHFCRLPWRHGPSGPAARWAGSPASPRSAGRRATPARSRGDRRDDEPGRAPTSPVCPRRP